MESVSCSAAVSELSLCLTGLYCERDINECVESPCHNGGTCHNIPGSFLCNCTPESSGSLCEIVNFTSIASSSFNITMEEIIGASPVVGAIGEAGVAVTDHGSCGSRGSRTSRSACYNTSGQQSILNSSRRSSQISNACQKRVFTKNFDTHKASFGLFVCT